MPRPLLCTAVVLASSLAFPGAAGAAHSFSTATNSSPIAMSAGQGFVWVVNPDKDTVSVIRTSTNEVIETIPVGNEPQGVALDPANRYAYVANAAGGTVSVIRIINPNPRHFRARVDRRIGRRGKLTTGAEPWNIVASPNGRRIFVANSSQDTITVIDATRRRIRRRIGGKIRRRVLLPRIIGNVDLANSRCNDPDRRRHFQPRGLAVTHDSKKLYVTGFLAFIRPGGRQGDDNGKEGVVCRLDINTKSRRIGSYRPAARITLAPRVTGFMIDSNPDTLGLDPTSAFPNQMQSIVIRGDRAYLPNVAASPSGPIRRNGNTHSFVNQIDGVREGTQLDAGALNLNLGAREPEAGKRTLFFANAWAIGFTSRRGPGAAYAVSAGSDLLVKVKVAADGTLSFTGGTSTTRYVDLNDPTNPATSGENAGKNPQGIVVGRHGTRAYVNNYVSRNVSVVDLTTDKVIKVIRTAPLPLVGSRDEVELVGAEMFYSSRGVFNRSAGATPITSTTVRLSSDGFGSCASCHFQGLSDGVVWQYTTGPRKTLPLNATFNPNNPDDQRILNYSATFDELDDVELIIRNTAGHGPGDLPDPRTCETPPPTMNLLDPDHGLLTSDIGNPNRAPCVIVPFAKPNANRPQFTVTLPGSNTVVPALTALREWVRFAVRTPNAPPTRSKVKGGITPAMVSAGRMLFSEAGCTTCHVGGKWTISTKDFKSPPAASQISTETSPAALFGSPVETEYLSRYLRDVGSFNLGVAGQGNDFAGDIGAVEKASPPIDPTYGRVGASPDALGRDYNGDGRGNGYNVPSLLGINAVPPYYHNGACETLDCVLTDVKHRTANGRVRDRLKTAKDRARLVAYLKSIDETTAPPRRRH